jgi:hypothetical protein
MDPKEIGCGDENLISVIQGKVVVHAVIKVGTF